MLFTTLLSSLSSLQHAEEELRQTLTKDVKSVVVEDLERKMHSALDDALNTIRGEVQLDMNPVRVEVEKIKSTIKKNADWLMN